MNERTLFRDCAVCMSKKRRKSVIQKVGGGIGYCHCEGSMGEGTRTSGILRIKYALDTLSDGGGSVLMGKNLKNPWKNCLFRYKVE